MRKLLLFDVDGTLVSYSGVIPESVKKGISEARSNGCIAFVVTGRGKSHVESHITNIGFDGFIYGNGARIEYGDQVIKDRVITDEEITRIVDYLEDHHLEFYMEGTDGLYGSHNFIERGEIALTQYGVKNPSVKASYPNMVFPENLYVSGINKVNYILESYQDYLDFKEAFPEYKVMTWGGKGESAIFGDCALEGIDKAEAIHELMDYLNITKEDTIAFGDAEVDLPMFSCAKESVCMGEGREAAKAAATYVTTKVEDDGIYHALKHFKLI